MSNTYYSPEGNPEIWDRKPKGYMSVAEWEVYSAAQQKIKDEEAEKERLLPQNLYVTRLREVEASYVKAMARLTRKYPDAETSTFYRQLQEAKDYLANSATADAPFIINAAKQRNISPTALANSILEKADTYAAISGYLTGLRYKYAKIIQDIGPTSTEALLNVDIDYAIVDEEVI